MISIRNSKNVLIGFGGLNPEQITLEAGSAWRKEPDDFQLDPHKWRLVGDEWQAYEDPGMAIRKLEEEQPITQRKLRELFMLVGQLSEAVTGQPIASNPSVKEILALEVMISAERAKL